MFGYRLTSVLNGGLALVRRLQRRGHDVVVLGIRDIEDQVVRQGFAFRPILEQLYPKGFLEADEKTMLNESFLPIKKVIRLAEAEMAAFADGELKRVLGDWKPDLVIGCADEPITAMAGATLGAPVCLYLTKPYSLASHGEPPLISSLVPSDGLGYRIQNWLAWRGQLVPRWIVMRGIGRWDYGKSYRAYARKVGFDPDKVSFDADYNFARLKIPHLVLWPRMLEFPRRQELPGIHYLESSADVDCAPAQDFAWEGIDPAKPLIYCSLGVTGTFMHREVLSAIFKQFLAALGKHPEWQGMLSLGKHEDPAGLNVPPNVKVYQRVPQIDVLKRTAVFVTQGGSVSLGEALALGVPTVITPTAFDQWGLAARITTHGLGVRAPTSGRHADEALAKLIGQVVHDPGFKQRALEMARKLRALEDGQRTAIVAEALIAGREPPALPA